MSGRHLVMDQLKLNSIKTMFSWYKAPRWWNALSLAIQDTASLTKHEILKNPVHSFTSSLLY